MLEVEHHDRDPRHQCQPASAGEQDQCTRNRRRWGFLVICHGENTISIFTLACFDSPPLAADGLRRQWIAGRWRCLGAPLLPQIESLQLGVVAQFGGATRQTQASPGSVYRAAGWDGPSGRGRSPASAAHRPRGCRPAAGERCRPVSRPPQALHPDRTQRPRPNERPGQHRWTEERAERPGAAPTVH